MNIELDDEQLQDIFSEYLINEIQFLREEIGQIELMEFMRATETSREDIILNMMTLSGLEAIAPYYLGKSWEARVNGSVSG